MPDATSSGMASPSCTIGAPDCPVPTWPTGLLISVGLRVAAKRREPCVRAAPAPGLALGNRRATPAKA